MEIIGTLNEYPFLLFLSIVVFSGVKLLEVYIKHRLENRTKQTDKTGVKNQVIKIAAEFKIDEIFIIRHYKKYYSVEHEYSPTNIRPIAGDWQKHPYDDYSKWATEKLRADKRIIINKKTDCDHETQLGIMDYYNVNSWYCFGLFREGELLGSLNCYFQNERGLNSFQLEVLKGKIATLVNLL